MTAAEAAAEETDADDDGPRMVGQVVEGSAGNFEAIVSASVLEDFVEPMDAIVDEFRLQITEDGFVSAVVDPAEVACAFVELDADGMESYRVEREGLLGLNISRITDLLKHASPDDLVHLTHDVEARKLEVEFDTVEATIACIDPDAMRHETDLPELDLAVDVSITGQQFARSIDLADLVSDHLLFRGDPDNRRWLMIGEGDTDDVRDTYEKADLIRGQIPDEHETLVSVDYLLDLGKPIPKGSEVRLRHGTEFPVQWEYEIGDAVSVTNMLAPRIEA